MQQDPEGLGDGEVMHLKYHSAAWGSSALSMALLSWP